MKKRTLSLSLLAILGLLVVTACGGLSLSSLNTTTAQNPAAPAATQVIAPPSGAAEDLLAAYQGTLEYIYSTVSPSVVNINVVQNMTSADTPTSELPGLPFFNLPEGELPQQQFQSLLGSGLVWDKEGHIVTNNHVVSGADKIPVTFSDGTIVPAELVGADPDSDLAVIKVDVPADQLQPVQMADSSAVKVGQMAIAIGNPFGLNGTMTTGIISAVGRSLPTKSEDPQGRAGPDAGVLRDHYPPPRGPSVRDPIARPQHGPGRTAGDAPRLRAARDDAVSPWVYGSLYPRRENALSD